MVLSELGDVLGLQHILCAVKPILRALGAAILNFSLLHSMALEYSAPFLK